MRLIVFLKPTNKRGSKTAYTKFRKFLEKDGYVLLQPEVFMLTVTSRNAAKSRIAQLGAMAPSTGQIRILPLTEKQYAQMSYLVGEADAQERIVGSHALVDL